jgi:uncharacterized protein
MKDYYLGSIMRDTPGTLKTVSVSDPCRSCDVFTLCGGRCLYANVTKLWGLVGFDEVCQTVRHLINGINEVLPEIRRLLQYQISLEDFKNPSYDGCEVIP